MKILHTINILDVEAIRRAMVAINNFPTSGFACNRIQILSTSKHLTTKLIASTNKAPTHLQVKVLCQIQHLQAEICKHIQHKETSKKQAVK